MRPEAIVVALRKAFDAPAEDMEEIVAFARLRQLARVGPGRDEEQGGPAGRGVWRRGGAAPPVLPGPRARGVQRHGPVAASIAVDALQPTAKAGRPVLDRGTPARMHTASDEYAEALAEEDLDDEDDLDEIEDLGAADGLVVTSVPKVPIWEA